MKAGSARIAMLLVALACAPAFAQPKEKPGASSAAPIEEMVPAEKVTGFYPGASTDFDLENIVYAAYRAARLSAIENTNYFVYGDVDADDIRLKIIRDLVQTGYSGVIIAYDEEPSLSYACAEPGTTELRLNFKEDGIGIGMVAVNATRYSAYVYDPDVSSELQITPPTDCEG